MINLSSNFQLEESSRNLEIEPVKNVEKTSKEASENASSGSLLTSWCSVLSPNSGRNISQTLPTF